VLYSILINDIIITVVQCDKYWGCANDDDDPVQENTT